MSGKWRTGIEIANQNILTLSNYLCGPACSVPQKTINNEFWRVYIAQTGWHKPFQKKPSNLALTWFFPLFLKLCIKIVEWENESPFLNSCELFVLTLGKKGKVFKVTAECF